MFNKLIQFLKTPHKFTQMMIYLSHHGFHFLFSDKFYIEKVYYFYLGKHINLKSPQTFNEKINWLKLYDRKRNYKSFVDKYESKKSVTKISNEINVIETYGVWDKFSNINFDSLPNEFVLKCTHDSGSVVICRDKKTFNFKKAKRIISKALKKNYYYSSREWQYNGIKPRIIAEKFMKDEAKNGLRDYKFYCFNGVPKFLYISEGLENHATAKISFLNLDWTFAPFERSDYKPFTSLPKKPKSFETMISICRDLSKDFPFVRVDLYEINGLVYFSELTFSPTSGFMPFKNEEDDYFLGKMLKIEHDKQ